MSGREQLLQALRPVSFAIAYRMLGSVSEAEDVVQEALLRVDRALQDGTQIASERAFTATVTTRLAINELHSARARRECYVGDWLPEPILTDREADPVRVTETADSVSLALLVALESLSPDQRAALLLHDVFDYSYREIAPIVGKREQTVRSWPHAPGATLSSAARAFRPPGSSAMSSHDGSSRPRTTAISLDSRRCSPMTWS